MLRLQQRFGVGGDPNQFLVAHHPARWEDPLFRKNSINRENSKLLSDCISFAMHVYAAYVCASGLQSTVQDQAARLCRRL